MATDRRKWHKVEDRYWTDDFDNDELAFLERFMGYLNMLWRTQALDPEATGVANVSRSIVLQLTGVEEFDAAMKVVKSAASKEGISVRLSGKRVEMIWPNYRKLQGYRPPKWGRSRGELGGNSGATLPGLGADQDLDLDLDKKEMSEVPSNGAAKPQPAEAEQLAEALLMRLEETLPGFKAAKFARWPNDIRLAHERDGRTWDEIEAAIEWLFDSEPGRMFTVHSGRALREKFERMRHAAKKESEDHGRRPKSGRNLRQEALDRIRRRHEASAPDA